MTDQTRTGTYGSWYNYYICGFAGKITLPSGLGNLPVISSSRHQLNNLNFHSSATRCNQTPMRRYSDAKILRSARSPWC